jgi:hypothetical protein
VNSRRSVLIVVNPAHVTLAETLVKNEYDLGSHLGTEEHSFLHAMATLGSIRIYPSMACADTGSVAIALVLEVWEVLRELQGLGRGWGLRMTGRAVVGCHVGIHGGRTGNGTGYAGVVVGGGHEERVHAVGGRVIHWARLAHGGWCIGTARGKRSAEGGGNFGGEDSAGRRENELLGNNAEQSLSEAYFVVISISYVCHKMYADIKNSPLTLLPHPTIIKESQSSLRLVASGTARIV